jgi:hypothetical protein
MCFSFNYFENLHNLQSWKGTNNAFWENSKVVKNNNHYEKKGCFATSLATHCIDTLGVLTNKLHEVVGLQLIVYMMQLNYNFVKTINFQLLCNSIITTPMMSCWHH